MKIISHTSLSAISDITVSLISLKKTPATKQLRMSPRPFCRKTVVFRKIIKLLTESLFHAQKFLFAISFLFAQINRTSGSTVKHINLELHE